MKTVWIAALAAVTLAGCRVKESEDAKGNTKYEVEPAKVEVGTDSATIPVPTVNVAPDSTRHDSTTTR